MEMDYFDYDKVLSESHEDAIEITLCNKQLGVSISIPVFPSNTLKQVLEGYHDLIGIPASQVPLYLDAINVLSPAHWEAFIKASYYDFLLGQTKFGVPVSIISEKVYDVDTPLKELGIKNGSTLSFRGV